MVTSRGRSDLDMYTHQAQVAYKNGNHKDALHLFNNAIRIDSSIPDVYVNRALVYMTTKRFGLALGDYQTALKCYPSAPPLDILIRVALCQIAVGSTEAACSSISSLLASEPSNTSALQLKNILETHMPQFVAARTSGDWRHAQYSFEQCLEGICANGGDIPPIWWVWKTEIELSSGKLHQANTTARKALKHAPESPDIIALNGLLLFLDAKIPEALDVLVDALGHDPEHIMTRDLIVRVECVRKAKEAGDEELNEGRLEGAVKGFRKALNFIGHSKAEYGGGRIRAMLLLQRSTAFVKLEKYTDALQDIEACLTLFPNSFKALLKRAIINLHLKQYDTAFEDFERARRGGEMSHILDSYPRLGRPVPTEDLDEVRVLGQVEAELSKGRWNLAAACLRHPNSLESPRTSAQKPQRRPEGNPDPDSDHYQTAPGALDVLQTRLQEYMETPQVWILQFKVIALNLNIGEFDAARRAKNWVFAGRALDRILRTIALGEWEIPIVMKMRKIERMLSRGNWGSSDVAALPAIVDALGVDDHNAPALELKEKILTLESHVRQLEEGRKHKDWEIVHHNLEVILRETEREGWSIPKQWFLWMVDVELSQGSRAKAKILANQCSRLFPESLDILVTKSLILFICGDLPEALEQLSLILNIDPADDAALRLRGRIQKVQKYQDIGYAAFRGGHFTEAIKNFGKALSVVGEREREARGGEIRVELLLGRSNIFLKLKEYDRALPDINEAISLASTCYQAFRVRALVYQQLGRLEDAIQDFKSAIQFGRDESSPGSDVDVQTLKAELRCAEVQRSRF